MTVAPSSDETQKDFVDDILRFSLLKEEAKEELQDLLESTRGTRKSIVIDPQLSGLVSIVLQDSSKFWKDNGVQSVSELVLDATSPFPDSSRDIPENVIYFIRAHLPNMKLIATQIRHLARAGVRSQFKVCFVPAQSTVCMHLLEEHIDNPDIWPRITFLEYRSGFIPFDCDLLSLEMTHVFKQCYVDGDLSCLNTISAALNRLQQQFGLIHNVKTKGVGAKKVLQRMLHARVEDFASNANKDSTTYNEEIQARGIIETLIIVDRETDLVSPLVTPLTYEGLVDDTFNIENGKIKVDASVLGTEEVELGGKAPATPSATAAALKSGEKVIMNLTGSDSIFMEIRNLSIERLGSYMQEKAITIRERYATFKSNKDATLAEIHEFVKKIPKLTRDFKSLNHHIHIAEKLKQRTDSRDFRDQWQMERGMLEGEIFLDQLEEMLYADTSRTQLYQVLRLLCLQSGTAFGIRSNRYDYLRRTIIQLYGFQHMYTLLNLERSGLIRRKEALLVVETTTPWQLLRKTLRLIDDKVSMARPEDINYVAAGYGPLLVRLVQLMLQTTLQQSGPLQEAMKLLPGPYIDINQGNNAEELSEILARQAVEIMSGGVNNASSALMNVMSAATDLVGGNSGKVIGDFTSPTSASSGLTKRVAMILVIGGISYLEISALRFLSNEPSFPYRIIIATTRVMNGRTFLSAMEHAL
jgi:hypothetical protein